MSNLRTIPMSTEQIQEIFTNADMHYNIDLKNSTLKGEAFITYIANMQINCSLATVEGTEKEDKFEILKHYLTYRQTIKCDTLQSTVSILLLHTLGVDVELSCDWLSKEEMMEFAESNVDQIVEVMHFLRSAPVIVSSFNKNFKSLIFDKACDNGEIQVIDEPDVVGVNMISLFGVPKLVEMLCLTMEEIHPELKDDLRYYKAQVERIQYNKKSLFDIFLETPGGSPAMAFSHILLNQSENNEEQKLFDSYS